MNTNITTQIKIKRLADWAKIPEYATDGSGCFDIWGLPSLYKGDIGIASSAEAFGLFETGLSIEIPKGYALMLYSRSGHGFNHGIKLANSVGVIDSDYRGEIMVKLSAQSSHPHGQDKLSDWYCDFYNGEKEPIKIAQGMIIPVPKITFQEVEELSETARGSGGFGSTGD